MEKRSLISTDTVILAGAMAPLKIIAVFVLAAGLLLATGCGSGGKSAETDSPAAASENATRDVTISVSGLPNGRTVDVWGGEVPSNATHGSEKLATFGSDHSSQVRVPSNLGVIQLTVRPLQQTGFNEKVGHQVTEDTEPGVRYITEKPQYDLAGITKLDVAFKRQYMLSLGTSATVRGTNMGAADSARALVHFDSANHDGWYDAGVQVTVTVSKGQSVQFAYWVIKDASSGGVNVSYLGRQRGAYHEDRPHRCGPGGMYGTANHPRNTHYCCLRAKAPTSGMNVPSILRAYPELCGEDIR